MKNKSTLLLIVFVAGLIVLITLISRKKEEVVPEIIPPKKEEPKPLPQSVTEFVNFIGNHLDSTGTVGAGLTIVYNNDVVVLNSYGVKQVGTTDSVNKHTVFRLASVSKGFAGVLASVLEQDHMFSLDDKIISFLPGFKLKDSINTQNLTIEHTLSHTSGLVPHAFDNLIEDGVPLPKIIDQLNTVDISAPPGLLYGYQNVVFSMIDTIARIQTHASYDKLLERRIFRPLHMRNASANAEIFLKKNGNFAYPHARTKSGYYALPVNLGYYNIPPAAGVNASIQDMSHWLKALLGGYPKVLDDSVLIKITTPVVVSPLRRQYTRHWGKLDSKYYSLGWRIFYYRGRKIVHHGGYVRGYRAEIAFCPDENIGVAFLQNSPNYLASMCLPTFFEMFFNEQDSIKTDTLPPIVPQHQDIADDDDDVLLQK